MIFDSIQNKQNYKDFSLIYQALEYLSSLNKDELPEPNTVLIPEKLFCNPVQFVSKPEEDCVYEAHRNYIDLHYIIEGIEKISTADISSLTTITPYAPEKDIEFLDGIADGYYNLAPGNFMICFPNDAHKVAMMQETPAEIKKIVFKIITEE